MSTGYISARQVADESEFDRNTPRQAAVANTNADELLER